VSKVTTEKYKDKRLSKIKDIRRKRLERFNKYLESVKDK